jgi:hypothetical protein
MGLVERLPARARTPAVARAVTSPSAILVAGAGASVAILAGAPAVLAGLAGAALWAGRVVLALPRRRSKERIEPRRLHQPWRSLVLEAMDARDRFQRAVAGTDPGPLRDRLAEVAARVAVGVEECWRIARRGNALDQAVSELDAAGVQRRLAEAQDELRRRPDRPELAATIEALSHQLESAERLAGVAESGRDRLRRLEAQLDEAAARAIELSLSAADLGALKPLGSDVETLVGELESLRSALDETASPALGAGGSESRTVEP